jgi:hypothetical protein
MAASFQFYDFMKMQLMLGAGSGSVGVRNVIALNLYELTVQAFPKWFPKLKSLCVRRQKTVPTISQQIRATISCERPFQSGNQRNGVPNAPNHSRMDSVVHYITTIPAIRNLMCITHTDYLPNEFDPIQIETDVFFELTEMKHTEGQLESIKFKLFCYDHEIQHIQAFIDRCNQDYERRMANKLGTNLYFFDMVTQSKSKKSIQNKLPDSHLIYTKHSFHTTRSFENVFFEQRDKVKKHVDFFLNRKDWYEKKGIPYTLGFMFHGDPGCGKTSTVKAIANTARRHIINIQLSQIKTKEQLRHLFFNDDIHVSDGIKTERFTIPVHERLYVIEDIDAMGDAVLERKWKKPVVKKEKVVGDDAWMQAKLQDEEEIEPIDLSFLLNLLDGTLEASGRILAISSNFPERIDKALIRPGRVDMIVHFRKCNRQILREMVDSFYDQAFEDWTSDSLEYKWSPAEVNQILFRNFTSSGEAIEELKMLSPKDLYGFEQKEHIASYEDFTQ